jgi:hypothetical protein
MVAAKIQLLMAIGVALSVVQAGPVDNSNGGNKPVLSNKVLHFPLPPSPSLFMSLRPYDRALNFIHIISMLNFSISLL